MGTYEDWLVASTLWDVGTVLRTAGALSEEADKNEDNEEEESERCILVCDFEGLLMRVATKGAAAEAKGSSGRG
jgi:hypothetical protein